MTRGRRPSASTIVLTAVSLGLGANAIMSGTRPSDLGVERRLEVSTIDLNTGSRDATLSARGMVPGDAVTAAVTVANSGRQPVSYGMSHGLVATDGAALSAALVLTIKTSGSSCADFDGATLFDGSLAEATFGGEGDGRPLPAATAEILCFRAALPRGADNRLQDGATTITLTFSSTLQAANP
jgi:hypothetical protein